MRVLIFGATGMVGQGVLRECLAAADVTEVVAVARRAGELPGSPKLRELVHADFFDWSGIDLSGFDACFFCLGVSAVGMKEAAYRRTTYDLTLAAAHALLGASPQATFIYVSGQGTDSSSRQMWARVKGATENALLAMPFRAVYCFRPGYIQPLHGVRSKVGWYNSIYAALGWLYPLTRKLSSIVTSSENVGLAMLQAARQGFPERILNNREINQLAAG